MDQSERRDRSRQYPGHGRRDAQEKAGQCQGRHRLYETTAIERRASEQDGKAQGACLGEIGPARGGVKGQLLEHRSVLIPPKEHR